MARVAAYQRRVELKWRHPAASSSFVTNKHQHVTNTNNKPTNQIIILTLVQTEVKHQFMKLGKHTELAVKMTQVSKRHD